VPVATENVIRVLCHRVRIVPYQASEDGHATSDAARRLAGPQDDRHGPARLRVHRRGSAGSSVRHNERLKQRELLMAVDDIAGVVDVQGDGLRARTDSYPIHASTKV